MDEEKTCFEYSPYIILLISLFLVFHYRKSGDMEPFDFKNHSEYCFATLTTPAFAMGAVALGHTLRKHHGNKYDLVCLVTYDVNSTWRQILSQWWIVIEIKEFIPFMGFRRSWSKIHLWRLSNYKKVVYIDTDILIFGTLDELFGYSQLSCVPDITPPQICNTGVLVLEPKEGIIDRMKHELYYNRKVHGIGDQGFINSFFSSFNPLPSVYNLPRVSGTALMDVYHKNKTKAIHFVCKKPWKCGREGMSYCGCGFPEFNKVWWDVWDEACHGNKCIESWKENKYLS